MSVRIAVAALVLFASASVAAPGASAHGGALDPIGCHHGPKQDGYHCHRGPFAHRTFATPQEAFEALRKAQADSLEALRAVIAAAMLHASTSLAATSLSVTGSIAGVASVIDAGTIAVRGQPIRLHGVDAPRPDDLCASSGRKFRCGQQAASALSEFVGGRTVRCVRRKADHQSDVAAACRVGGQDLGAWLVRRGHARADRVRSQDYVAAEQTARAARLGIWGGGLVAD